MGPLRNLLFLLVIAATLGAQTTNPPSKALPAHNLVEQLEDHALLHGRSSMSNFHLTAEFEAAGPVEFKGAGTYEEWFDPAGNRWRKELTLGNYHLVLIFAKDDLTRQSSENYIPMRVSEMLTGVLPILPSDAFNVQDNKYKVDPTELEGLAMVRLAREGTPPKDGKRFAPEWAYYIIPERNLIVMHAMGDDVWIYDKPAKLGDRNIMLDGLLKRNGEAALKFHITSLKSNETFQDSLFTPAPGAVRGFPYGVLQAGKAPVKVNGKIDIEKLRLRGIGGRVAAAMQIDPQGKVREVEVVGETDKILADMVAYDLHHFAYQPVVVDGQPQSVSFYWAITAFEQRPSWNYK